MGNNPISLTDPDGGSTQCEGCPGKGTTTDPYQLQEVVIRGTPKPSTLATVVDVGTDFLPFSGIKDVYRGYQSGNGWQMAMGIGFIAFDAATFGSGSLLRGGIKTAMKAEKLIDIYQGTKKAGKYFGQSVNLAKRYTNKVLKKEFIQKPKLIAKVPERIADAVEQQLISIHGTVKHGNGMGGNKRLQMSLKNQIENKEVMKEAMDFLDNNVPNWMIKF
jgi:hypothetical protein